MAQGKAWKKEEVVEALKSYFLMGYSVNKACALIEFPSSTFKTWLGKDAELRLKIEAWQKQVGAVSRKNIVEAIKGGDLGHSKWWLENLEKDDFGKNLDLTSGGEKIDGFNLMQQLGNELKQLISETEDEGNGS